MLQPDTQKPYLVRDVVDANIFGEEHRHGELILVALSCTARWSMQTGKESNLMKDLG